MPTLPLTPVRAVTAAFAAALVAGVVMLPGAASAGTHNSHDTWGDVEVTDVGQDPVPDPVADPARKLGDITELRVGHSATNVHVALYYRALVRAGQTNIHSFQFDTPNAELAFDIKAGPGNWDGTPIIAIAGGNGGCKIKYSIQYSHKRVVVDVPRSCLGYPSYVQVGARSLFKVDDLRYYDNALNDGNGDAWPTVGPAVFR